MAYCRFGKSSDVYMYSSVTGGYQFHLNRPAINGKSDFNIKDDLLALHKLRRLKTQGFKVPDYAIERMEKEALAEYGEKFEEILKYKRRTKVVKSNIKIK